MKCPKCGSIDLQASVNFMIDVLFNQIDEENWRRAADDVIPCIKDGDWEQADYTCIDCDYEWKEEDE